jgi:hypothetical protein
MPLFSLFLRTPASAFVMVMAMILSALAALPSSAAEDEQEPTIETLRVAENVFLGILPRHLRSADLLKAFSLVIDLRYPYEGVYEEVGMLRTAGITHVNLPTSSHGPDQDTVETLKKLLEEHPDTQILIHDSNGYRTAMVWAAYRVDAGADPAAAIEEVDDFVDDPELSRVIQRYAELRGAHSSDQSSD